MEISVFSTNMASAPGPAMEFLGRVAFEATKMRPLLPTYLHLLLSAVFPIYTAAHASLTRPSSAAKLEKRKKATDGDASDDDDDVKVVRNIESLTAMDALTFPLLAGATLTSLYFLIKWLEDPAILNKILAVYFSQMGLFFGVKFLKDVLSTIRSIFLPVQYSLGGIVWHADPENRCFSAEGPSKAKSHPSPLAGGFRNIPLPKKLSSRLWTLRKRIYSKSKLRLDIHKIIKVRCAIDILDIISLAVVSQMLVWQTFVSTPWYLTNFMGFSFCYGSLQMVTPTTGWIGSLVLSALFFYDIYFVFFTPMMVTVATKLEVPIKLLFPRPRGCAMPVGALEGSEAMQEYLDCLAKKRTMAMLGLGDIVIPGMMLAFALRFDLYRFYLGKETVIVNDSGDRVIKKKKYMRATGSWGERFWTSAGLQSEELQAKTFPKPYFHAGVIGYVAGMVVTMIVMQVAQHAQPALLYLVPGVLISLWGTALFKGDLKLFWSYTEEEQEEEKDNKEAGDQKAKTGDKDNKEKEGQVSKADSNKEETTNAEVTSPKTKSTIDAPSKSKPVAPNPQRYLINFSITRPTVTKPSTTQSSHPATPTPSPTSRTNDNDTTVSKSSSNTSSDSSYDVLPDIKADHELMDMLGREITQAKWKEEAQAPVTTGQDGEPLGKRRRKE